MLQHNSSRMISSEKWEKISAANGSNFLISSFFIGSRRTAVFEIASRPFGKREWKKFEKALRMLYPAKKQKTEVADGQVSFFNPFIMH